MPTVARRYAKGLFQFAKDEDCLSQVVGDFLVLEKMMEGSPDLVSVLKNPLIEQEKLSEILKALSEKSKFSKATSQFLEILTRQKRLNVLRRIIIELKKLGEYEDNVTSGEVVTAHALSLEHVEKLEKTLSEKLNSTVELEQKVEPDVLGGMIIKVGSYLIDSSLKNKLNRMQLMLRGR